VKSSFFAHVNML